MQNSLQHEEIDMLRSELEILMKERQALLQIAGAAAGLVAELDSRTLPQRAVEAAERLACNINELPEEWLREALMTTRSAALQPSDE